MNLKVSEIQSFLDAFQLTQGIVCEECKGKIQKLLINPAIYHKVRILQQQFNLDCEEMMPKDQRAQKLRKTIASYIGDKECIENQIRELEGELKTLTS